MSFLLLPLLSTLAAAPPALAATDPLAAARAALTSSDAAAVEAALASTKDAPGLRGALLDKLGKRAEACALYDAERQTTRAPAAALRAARCKRDAGDAAGALVAYTEVGTSLLAESAAVIAEIAAFVDAQGVPPGESLARALTLEVGPFDRDSRAALAVALDVLARQSTSAEARTRAARRLADELFDTPAGQRFVAQNPQPPVDLHTAVVRAAALEKRQESEALVTLLAPLVDDKAFDANKSDDACDARLMLGKAHRKLRQYAKSRSWLAAVDKRCEGDAKKRARYLEAKVAAIQKSPQAKKLLETFAFLYPKDALTDDVLVWLGELLDDAGDPAGAEQAWLRVQRDHPDGDMVHDALFFAAMLRARRGDVAGAGALLDDAARVAGQQNKLAALDRATYWRARLDVFPTVFSWSTTKDAQRRAAGERALLALAKSRPASFYGHLARLVVANHVDGGAAAVAPIETAKRAAAWSLSLFPSTAVSAEPHFALARTLIEAGYDDEGLLSLSEIPDAALSANDRFVVALLLSRAGAPGAGHGFLRNGGLALLPGSPQADAALAWTLSWPRAYASSIEAAAKNNNVPPNLLLGIAREESAFDPEVVSWAGAVGLCQLMPTTADDEAKSKKQPSPSIDDLKDPDRNADLGAAHIGRRLRGMGHPLLAIAAYNAGPKSVMAWQTRSHARSGVAGPLPLDAFVEDIPVEETRNYVKKVTGSWVTYSALDAALGDVSFALDVR